MSFIYKIAETASEFEQIHQLNYETFVEEIPQHQQNKTRILIDKFHKENTYIICLKNKRVIGMIAVRSIRPFSVDEKVGKVEQHLSFKIENPVEIRLLAIEKKYRNGRPFLGLAQALVRYCLKVGADIAFISGTVREQKLYAQLGFTPFAQLVGDKDAAYQPMYLTRSTFDAGIAGRLSKPQVNFLPGPATISEEVRDAMIAAPYSHRSLEFDKLLLSVRNGLTTLTNAKHVQILQGTGTLANDVIAAQLSLLRGKGLILINGEFGERLRTHALGFSMEFDSIKAEWGSSFNQSAIIEAIETGAYSWLWIVYCETSTGVLNNFDKLSEICAANKITLAVDSVSAIGSMPVDFSNVDYASGVSGKGLLSYTGLSFVFHNKTVKSNKHLPRYLDLGAYAEAGGIPYSQSSNLLAALDEALKRYTNPSVIFNQVSERSEKVREVLAGSEVKILSSEYISAAAIMTLILPERISATKLGDNLYLNGFTVHYESYYLRDRNWLQISCMNNLSNRELDNMLKVLYKLVTSNNNLLEGSVCFERTINN